MLVNNYLITTTELKTLGYTSQLGVLPPADSLKMVSKQTATTYYDVPPTATWTSLTPDRVPKYQDFPIACYCYVSVENTLEGNPDPAPVTYEDCSGNILFSSVPFGQTLILNPCYYVSGDSGPLTGCGIKANSVYAPGCDITYSTRRDVPQVCTTTTTTTIPPTNCYIVNGYVDEADLNASYNFEVCFDWYDCDGTMVTQCTISSGGFTLPYNCWNPTYGYLAYYYQYPGGPKVPACCSYLDAYNPCGPTTTTTTTTTSYPIGNQPISSVAVSKDTGQYMVASIGTKYIVNCGGNQTLASLVVSSNYGASWARKINGVWTKVAVSGNGQYMLAVGAGDYAWQSTNYGSTWSVISSIPAAVYSGCAISGDGQYQTIVGYYSGTGMTFYIYRSLNYGATWTAVSQYKPTGSLNPQPWQNKNFSGCAMTSNGVHQILITGIDFVGPFPGYPSAPVDGYVYYSSNGTSSPANFNDGSISAAYLDQWYTDVTCSPSGDKLFTTMSNTPSPGSGPFKLYKSTNYGANWTMINGNNSWIGVTANDTSISLGVVCGNTYIKVINAASVISDLTGSGVKSWKCVNVNNDGQYILAGATNGLFLSTDFGTTFTAK